MNCNIIIVIIIILNNSNNFKLGIMVPQIWGALLCLWGSDPLP